MDFFKQFKSKEWYKAFFNGRSHGKAKIYAGKIQISNRFDPKWYSDITIFDPYILKNSEDE